jgi:hypothetical protein
MFSYKQLDSSRKLQETIVFRPKMHRTEHLGNQTWQLKIHDIHGLAVGNLQKNADFPLPGFITAGYPKKYHLYTNYINGYLGICMDI